MLISGMGELHLEIIVDRLIREFKVEANIGKPQVSYKETVTGEGRGEGRFEPQGVNKSQYGHVVLEVCGMPPESGNSFSSALNEDLIPAEFVQAIKKSVESCLDSGVLLGFPVTDTKVTLVGGSYHEEDSTIQAFGVAANVAFRKACLDAQPVLMEPMMKLEVIVPDEHLGDVINDLNSKRAKIYGMDAREHAVQAVEAHVPLAQMFGYSTDLRSATQGRGSFSMHFHSYEEIPARIADNIIRKIRGL